MIAVTPSWIPAAPSGLMFLANPIHGLTPMATSSRPSGTEIPNSQPCGDLAATRLLDVAMGVSPWNRNCDILSRGGTTGNPLHGLTPMATSSRPSGTEIPNSQPCGDLAATRLPDVTLGVSPWDRNCGSLSPGGTIGNPIHGLTPMAISSRPSGTEIPNSQPCGDLAATRLPDVAMGVSPWDRNCDILSPGGTTGKCPGSFPAAPSGLMFLANPIHGLTPMATSSRPSGTRIQNRPPRLVAELHAQFAESAKREQDIKANLRGLGYGG